MVITPNSDIYLLKTPFELDENHTLHFASQTVQHEYFNSLNKILLEDATYQRQDGSLRWPGSYDDVIEYNYCMYRNTGFSNKWFYAFIEDIKFINPNMTEIKLKTDVIQTWYYDIRWKNCFVEREHVNNDTVGLHTIDEGLATGNYICNYASNITIGTGDLICCLCSDFPTLMEQYFKKSTYNSIYSGAKGVLFATTQDASYFVQYMASQQKADAIVSLFMLPNSIISGDMTFITKQFDLDPNIFGVNHVNITFAPVDESTGETYMGQTTISNLTSLNGYTPKNKKLLTGKYNYFYISNNAGIDVEYHYEDFVSNTPTFELIGAFAVGGSIKLIPKNYLKYSDVNDTRYFYNYGVTGAKYPICSWNSDSYTAWLSENSLNLAIDNTTNVGQIIAGSLVGIGGLATGNLGVALAGGISALSGGSGILNNMKENYLHSRVPNQARGNTNSGEVQYASGKNCFTLFKMTIKQEYAKIIDDYFSAYGYKVNAFKEPNITGRTNWNYVKLGQCNIVGEIPQKDLQEIKKIFLNGITFWHNPNTMLNYSQSNNIVT